MEQLKTILSDFITLFFGKPDDKDQYDWNEMAMALFGLIFVIVMLTIFSLR